MSERLEEIKNRFSDYKYDFNLRTEDIDWLIKQAERVQELDEEVDRLKVWYGAYHRETKATSRLRDENKRLREALEFYADENNWITSSKDVVLMDGEPETVEGPPLAIEDSGENARQALESDEN